MKRGWNSSRAERILCESRGNDQSSVSDGLALPVLSRLRCRLYSRRFRFTALGTPVFFRGRFIVSASRSRPANLSTAASRFVLCVRCFWDTTRRIPSREILVASLSRILSRRAPVRVCERAMSNSNVTRVFSLFTFCPPGPLERENVNEISSSGIESLEFILIIFPSVPVPLESLMLKKIDSLPLQGTS